MNSIKFKFLLLAVFLVFTQGLLERIFFMSNVVSYAVEASILLAVTFYFKYSFNVPGSEFFIVFLIVSFFIGFVNGNSIVETFLYQRYLIFTYLLYNQMYVIPLHLKQWKTLIKFLIFMILLQGIGAAFNVFVLEQRIEGYVGVMSSLGGTTATAFPVLISVLIVVFYLFKPNMGKKDWLWCALLLFSVFIVGYSSGKRGIYFYIPIYLFLSFLLAAKYLLSYGFFKKKMFTAFLVLIVLFPLFIYGIKNSKGFSYNLNGSENATQTIHTAINYAETYEASKDQYGRTIGRSNTTGQILMYSFSKLSSFFFGEGYGAVKSIRVQRALGFKYGVVGFTRDLISGGWFLMLGTVFLFHCMIMRNKSRVIKITKVSVLLLMLVFIGVHFFYSSDFVVSLKLNLILIPVIVLVNSPYHFSVFKYFLNLKKMAFKC